MKYLSLLLITLSLIGCSGNNKSEISASGTIEGTDVTISAEVGGKIKEIRIDEGSQVKEGDTLILLTHSNADIELRQAEANSAAAEAQYKLAVRGSREEDIRQAEANYKSAEDDRNRIEDLFKSSTVTQKQLDDARTRFTLTQQALEKLKRGSLPEEIDAARARRDQAIAQVDVIRKKIRDSYVIAPSKGVVTLKTVEPGELVTIGANLLRLTYLDKVKLTIYVGEEQLAKVRLGQEAKVYIDAAPDKPFAGTVTYISSIAEFTPKNVQTKEDRTKLVFGVKIEIPNPDQVLKPGMPADARLY